jgi:hypothetical protein
VTVNWYRIRPTAKLGDLATAFYYRRVQYVGPQKCGKGPWLAKKIKGQAGGPVVFDGWAEGGEVYRCEDYGCPCGWEYVYAAGEPMGKPWAKPLIQMLATSEDQVDNVYDPLKAMLKHGPDAELYTVGEEFTRLPGDGLIETSRRRLSRRLGNPIIFAGQDETGSTPTRTSCGRSPRRSAAARRHGRPVDRDHEPVGPGRGLGRAAHVGVEGARRLPVLAEPRARAELRHADGKPFSFWKKRERRKILAHVYQGITTPTSRASRPRRSRSARRTPARPSGSTATPPRPATVPGATPLSKWTNRAKKRVVKPATPIVVGFDGSDIDDWTGFRCETRDGYQFTPDVPDGTPMIWDPAEFGGQVPRLEVDGWPRAHHGDLPRDPRLLRPALLDDRDRRWAEKYGDKVIIRWYTQRPKPMHAAAERLLTDIGKADSTFSHDGCETTEQHIGAAQVQDRNGPLRPRQARRRPQDRHGHPSILAHEAAGDVTAADLWPEEFEASSTTDHRPEGVPVASAEQALAWVNKLYDRLVARRPEVEKRWRYVDGQQPLVYATDEWKKFHSEPLRRLLGQLVRRRREQPGRPAPDRRLPAQRHDRRPDRRREAAVERLAAQRDDAQSNQGFLSSTSRSGPPCWSGATRTTSPRSPGSAPIRSSSTTPPPAAAGRRAEGVGRGQHRVRDPLPARRGVEVPARHL